MSTRTQYGCSIANTYDCEDAKKLLDGFNIISIDHRHIFPYQIKPYKNGKLIKESWFENMSQKFLMIEKNLGMHLPVKAKKVFK